MAERHREQRYRLSRFWSFDLSVGCDAAAVFPLWARTLIADIQALAVYYPEDWQVG